MKGCIMADRLLEAAEAAEHCTTLLRHPRMFLRAASIYAQLKRWDKVEEVLARGLAAFPEAAELQAAHAEVLQHKRQSSEEGSMQTSSVGAR